MPRQSNFMFYGCSGWVVFANQLKWHDLQNTANIAINSQLPWKKLLVQWYM